MLYAVFWTWLHLLQLCVSNQSLEPEEDASNKPWRPIPSGLISVAGARCLRWILLPLCLSLSVYLEVHWQGISLALAFLVYGELHLHSHWIMRNVCNTWGYASFNAGAFAIAAGTFYAFISRSYLIRIVSFALGQSTLTLRTMISFAINVLITLSTIHAQDFADEVGDKLIGRRTVPIVWPEGSRTGILVMLTTWSIGLSWACGLAFPFSMPFCAWAVFIGLRFFRKRTAEEDQLSYRYYNVRFFNMSTAQSQLNAPPF